jgi:hypothetical protein
MLVPSIPIGHPKADRPIGSGSADCIFRLLNCRLVFNRLTDHRLVHTLTFSIATWVVGRPLTDRHPVGDWISDRMLVLQFCKNNVYYFKKKFAMAPGFERTSWCCLLELDFMLDHESCQQMHELWTCDPHLPDSALRIGAVSVIWVSNREPACSLLTLSCRLLSVESQRRFHKLIAALDFRFPSITEYRNIFKLWWQITLRTFSPSSTASLLLHHFWHFSLSSSSAI